MEVAGVVDSVVMDQELGKEEEWYLEGWLAPEIFRLDCYPVNLVKTLLPDCPLSPSV